MGVVVNHVMGKVTSGRFLLTQAAALCMIIFVVTDCYIAIKYPDQKLPISVDGVVAVITMVFVSYFQKKDGEGESVAPAP